MGPTCKSYVLELLENSSHRLRQIELMRYELQHIPQVSDSEMIEAMSLPSLTSSEKATNSKVVPDVALSYKKTAERMNAEALGELASAYVNLWREHDRLQHYIGLLDERQEFPIVKDTTPNMMNPRLYTTSYNKPQGQQFDDTAVLSFIKLQYT